MDEPDADLEAEGWSEDAWYEFRCECGCCDEEVVA